MEKTLFFVSHLHVLEVLDSKIKHLKKNFDVQNLIEKMKFGMRQNFENVGFNFFKLRA